MRKISVIGASLLLLALGSCSREKDITPADGFVKMRFTAVVGDTRTAYEGDKTASWVAGDAISVYVTNGTDGQVVTFTADESLTFEGNVPAGYTTIVAGAYPADAAHTFDANGVKTIHFPASYTLAAGADPASVIPLAGTFANGVMSFSHPAGALKFTIDNVPATAVRFRFTTFGHKINGNYALDAELDDTLLDAEKSVDINFPAAAGTHTFYVPMPAGELYADSVIALYDADNKLVYHKVAPKEITVTKNVIKRIATVEGWKKNEAWQATYLRDEYSSSAKKVYSKVRISGTTGKYGLYLATKNTFDTKYGSAEGFLASNYIPEKKAAGTNPYTSNAIINYTKMSTGQKVMVIYGVDDDYNFTGEYNLVEFEVPEFITPDDWSMTFKPEYEKDDGSIVQAVSVHTDGSSWGFIWMKKSIFESNYGSDPVAAIWSKRTSSDKLRTSKSISLLLGTIEEGEYVFLCYGMDERVDEDSDRTPTFKYCLLEETYTLPKPASEAYTAWIGQWNVTEDEGDEPNTDVWTIVEKVANVSYTVTGLCDNTSNPKKVEAQFVDGKLKFQSQFDFATASYSSGVFQVSLVAYSGNSVIINSYTPYDLMEATLDGDTATLTGFTYSKYNLIRRLDHTSSVYAYGKARMLPATMTRVVNAGVLRPDGESAEEEAGLPEADAPVVEDDALPGE